MIFDLGTESFGNGSFFTELKENPPFITFFGPMYIDFDVYPRYNGRISEIFGRMLLKIFSVIMVMLIFQAKQLVHGLMKKFGQLWKQILDAKQIKYCPKSILCKEYIFVKKYRNESEGGIDYLPDNEPTFSS